MKNLALLLALIATGCFAPTGAEEPDPTPKPLTYCEAQALSCLDTLPPDTCSDYLAACEDDRERH